MRGRCHSGAFQRAGPKYYGRMVNRTAAILIGISLAILSACQDQTNEPLEPVDYIPDTGWDGDEWAVIYEEWFGAQLRAMREPVLSSPSNLGGYTERFRLLVLPTFEPGRSYRFDWLENGEAEVSWVQLDGAGGYDPGRIDCKGGRTLAAVEARTLRTELEAVDLFSLPTADELQKESSTACFDGTALIFEHLSEGSRLFITRHCHVEPEVERLSRKVQELGSPSPVEKFMCLMP
jgi:hypothetical protein